MTAAYRLKGVGWLGASVAIVLGFYLVSLQVAATRKKLTDVDVKIASAERDIRALETEFDTRANLAQLEKWNGDTLALTAPIAGQFVTDEAALASMDARMVPAEGATQMAALVVPSLPTLTPAPAAPVMPMPQAVAQQAVTVVRSPSTGAATATVIRVAAVSRPMPIVAPTIEAQKTEARRTETARAVAAVAKVRPQAVAMLDRKLLSDTTLGDLLANAKAEAGRRR